MDIIGFALAVLVIELTPGPNMAWLSGLAATEGRRAGIAAVAGVAAGLLVNGVLAALGLAVLLEAAPWLWHALRWAGAAMMAFLAIEAWRGARAAQAPRPASQTVGRAFMTGLLINLLNPKAYIFFVAVAPRFLHGNTLTLGNALALALISAGVATLIHLGIVFMGAQAHGWLADPRRTHIARRGFALIMLAVAASFVLADLTAG